MNILLLATLIGPVVLQPVYTNERDPQSYKMKPLLNLYQELKLAKERLKLLLDHYVQEEEINRHATNEIGDTTARSQTDQQSENDNNNNNVSTDCSCDDDSALEEFRSAEERIEELLTDVGNMLNARTPHIGIPHEIEAIHLLHSISEAYEVISS